MIFSSRSIFNVFNAFFPVNLPAGNVFINFTPAVNFFFLVLFCQFKANSPKLPWLPNRCPKFSNGKSLIIGIQGHLVVPLEIFTSFPVSELKDCPFKGTVWREEYFFEGHKNLISTLIFFSCFCGEKNKFKISVDSWFFEITYEV